MLNLVIKILLIWRHVDALQYVPYFKKYSTRHTKREWDSTLAGSRAPSGPGPQLQRPDTELWSSLPMPGCARWRSPPGAQRWGWRGAIAARIWMGTVSRRTARVPCGSDVFSCEVPGPQTDGLPPKVEQGSWSFYSSQVIRKEPSSHQRF